MATRHRVRTARDLRKTASALAFALAFAIVTTFLVSALTSGAAGADPACDRFAAPNGVDTAPGRCSSRSARSAGSQARSSPGRAAACAAAPTGVTSTSSAAAPPPPGAPSELSRRARRARRAADGLRAERRDRGAEAGRRQRRPRPSPLVTASDVLIEDNEITNGHTADCLTIGTSARRVSGVVVRAQPHPRLRPAAVDQPPQRDQRHVRDRDADRRQLDLRQRRPRRAALSRRGRHAGGRQRDRRQRRGRDGRRRRQQHVGRQPDRAQPRSRTRSSATTSSRTGRRRARSGSDNVVRENCFSGGVRDDGDGGIADLRDRLGRGPQPRGRSALRRPRGARTSACSPKSPCHAMFGEEPAVSCNRRSPPPPAPTAPPGTTAQPVPHRATGSPTRSKPGQTGCLRGGHLRGATCASTAAARAGAPVTLTSYPGERADGQGPPRGHRQRQLRDRVAARPRRHQRGEPAEPDHQRRRRDLRAQRRHEPPHHDLLHPRLGRVRPRGAHR